MIKLIENGTISGKMAKEVSEAMYRTGKAPEEIVKEKGLVQITDLAGLTHTATATVGKYPEQVAQYRAGKEKVFGFFVGQVMKETQGKANPQLINDLLKKLLAKDP
jgi:aspartyl-tRNA(Asn)/glutamyl-tRNA(Gln) amidotransferase subunit B